MTPDGGPANVSRPSWQRALRFCMIAGLYAAFAIAMVLTMAIATLSHDSASAFRYVGF